MGDIQVSGLQIPGVSPTNEMIIKHRNIQIQERKSRMKGLQQRINDFDTIEKPNLELEIETLQQQVQAIEQQIKEIIVDKKGGSKVIDAEYKKTG